MSTLMHMLPFFVGLLLSLTLVAVAADRVLMRGYESQKRIAAYLALCSAVLMIAAVCSIGLRA